MKKIFLVLLALAIILPLTNAAYSQRVPDNDRILTSIIDSESPYYYPGLMLRYELGDTTLTLDDYHYLYYGYAYQDSYKPLEPIPAEDKLLMLLEAGENVTGEQARRLVDYATEVMKYDPFSPKNINFLTYGYVILGDTLNARVNADRLGKILTTIESSGTGLKEGSAWHVLWFSHATDIIGSRNLKIRSRTVRSRTVEYVALKEKDGNVKGYYFDFGRMYWKRPETPQKQKRVDGFQLNGINLGRNKNTKTPAR